MLAGDDSGDEEPSAAPHVDLDKVVEAINEKLGAHYSEKYRLSRFIKYNGERYMRHRRLRKTNSKPGATIRNLTEVKGTASNSAKRDSISRHQ